MFAEGHKCEAQNGNDENWRREIINELKSISLVVFALIYLVLCANLAKCKLSPHNHRRRRGFPRFPSHFYHFCTRSVFWCHPQINILKKIINNFEVAMPFIICVSLCRITCDSFIHLQWVLMTFIITFLCWWYRMQKQQIGKQAGRSNEKPYFSIK
jgi:hypothetical protein